MDRFELTFTPDYRTLLQTTAALGRRRYPAGLRWRLSLIYFGIMILGGGLLGGGAVTLWLRAGPLAGVAYAVALTLVLIWCNRFILTPWIVRTSASAIAEVRPAEPNHFSADAQGMRWVGTTTDFHLRWNGVEAVFAENGSLAFMTSAMAATVPLSAFRDAGQVREFLNLVIANLPPAAADQAKGEASLASFR